MRMFYSHRSGFKKTKNKPTVSHFLFLLLELSLNSGFQFSVDSQPSKGTKEEPCSSEEAGGGLLSCVLGVNATL